MSTNELFQAVKRTSQRSAVRLLVITALTALSSGMVGAATPQVPTGAWGPTVAKIKAVFVGEKAPAASPQGAQAATARPGQQVTADGKVVLLVKMAPDLPEAAQAAALARAGAAESRGIGALRLHVVRVPQAAADAVMQRFQSDPQIERVERDQTRQMAGAPSDPGHAGQWSLQTIGWNDVWGSVSPAGSATIAVLDTGVSRATGDINVGAGWSAFGTDPGVDAHGHGTWVASIAAATTDNAKGIAGVAFANTTVVPVQVLDASGQGQDSDIIDGLVWAADNGADVILMAFSSAAFSASLQDAIDYAWSKGAVIVAATGNGGLSTPTFPAANAKVIGVSATDETDAFWPVSNYGQSVFLAAPGVGISALSPTGSLISYSGTSASAAMVAGAAALLKANDALATNEIIAGRLARNAEPVGTPEQTGNGRLNLARAISDVTMEGIAPAGAEGGADVPPSEDPYVVAANNDAHVAPQWAPGNTVVTFNTLYRVTTGGTVQHVKVTLPAGYTNITPGATAFSSGTWGTPTVSGQTVSVALTSGTGLAIGGWARVDITAQTPASQSGNAAQWLLETFTDVAGTTGKQDDEPAVLVNNSTNPSATITFVDMAGNPIGSPVLEDGVAATVRVRVSQTGNGVKYMDVAVPPCFSSPTAVTTTSSAGGNGGYTSTVTDGFIRLSIGQIPANGFVIVQFDTTPSCTSGLYTVSTSPSTNASNPPSTTNQSVATTGGSLTVIAGRADLSITKTDSPDPVAPGGALSYTIAVTSAGPDPATAVKVTDPLPSGVTFVSFTGTDSAWTCVNPSGTVTCSLAGSLASGATSPDIKINVTAPGADTTISNTATVSSPHDITPGNNTATASTTVKANTAPTATPQSVSTNEDTAKTITLSATDPDDDTLTFAIGTGPTKGTLGAIGAVTCSGTAPKTCTADVSYTPNSNFNGSDSFTFTVNDGTATSTAATVSITVDPINDKPTAAANPASLSIDEDAAATPVELSGTDVETNASGLKFVITQIPANGVLKNGVVTLAASDVFVGSPSTVTYQPNANFNGTDSFKFKVTDSGDPAGCSGGAPACAAALDSDEVSVTITVRPVNDAPVSQNDAYATDEDVQLVVTAPGVLTNDQDVDGDGLSAVLVSGPSNGTLTLNADGSFTYTPTANFHGSDAFTYKANDGTVDSNTATVTITVRPVNDAPAAQNDAYATDEDVQLVVTAPGVLTNDQDVDGDALSAVQVTGPANGTLTLNADGSFTYTPNANFHGSDAFTYKTKDPSNAESNVATVTITVRPVNDAPVAVDDSYATDEDTPLTVPGPGVLANDTDVDGDTLTAVQVTGPANGTLTLNVDGSFTYTPNANFHGSDAFTYKAKDPGNAESNVATVTITVRPVNDAPVAQDGTLTTAEDTPANGTLVATDVDSTSLTYSLVTPAAHGTVTITNPATGAYSYTPAPDYFGPDSFTFKACDDAAPSLCSNTATVVITVTAVNDAPVALGDAYTTDEDVALTVPAPGVLANDTDVDGDALTAVQVTGPANGTLTLNANGSFTYTPNANFNGTDTFKYKANDGTADSQEATVTITVTPVNDAPDAKDDTASTNEDTAVTVPVLANDTDVDADPLTVSAVTQGTNGTVVVNGNNTVTYTPNLNFHGTDSFTYTVSDGNGGTDTATVAVTVVPVNDAPVLKTLSVLPTTINENGSVTLTGSFEDPDGDAHTVTINWGDGSAQQAVNVPAGQFTFTVPDRQYLDDNPTNTASDVNTITVTVSDASASSVPATATVTVNNLNPVVGAVSGPTDPVALGTTITVSAPFTDVGTRDTHTCLITWDDGGVTNGLVSEANGSGTCTGTRKFAATGVYTVSITVTDDDTGSGTTSATLLVVVYDPNAGFVTGGGWIESPAGAYRVNAAALTLTGRANFGFVSQYKKGANLPTGQTEFQFQAGSLNFHSSVYEWLVVSGCKAQFKGSGTVNGVSGYKFLLTATDGNKCSTTDKFRMKITDSSGQVVYDNNVASAGDDIDAADPQTIASGSIVIHEQGKK